MKNEETTEEEECVEPVSYNEKWDSVAEGDEIELAPDNRYHVGPFEFPNIGMPQFRNQNVTTGRAMLEGISLFANRNFTQGEVILDGASMRPVLDEEFMKMPEIVKDRIETREDGTHVCLSIPEWYIHYSPDPNAEMQNGTTTVALRGIAKGEEITYKD